VIPLFAFLFPLIQIPKHEKLNRFMPSHKSYRKSRHASSVRATKYAATFRAHFGRNFPRLASLAANSDHPHRKLYSALIRLKNYPELLEKVKTEQIPQEKVLELTLSDIQNVSIKRSALIVCLKCGEKEVVTTKTPFYSTTLGRLNNYHYNCLSCKHTY
jgi:DNA-directed RNA polymerase subunit M/transcription elongation factor TFIIS